MTQPDEATLRQAAQSGDTSAMVALADLLAERAGYQETDEEEAAAAEAREWAMKAAEAGDVEGMYLMGMILVGDGDMEEAQPWLQRAADAGHDDAMDELGSLYNFFEDTDQALLWYQRAADLGNGSAASNLRALKADLKRM